MWSRSGCGSWGPGPASRTQNAVRVGQADGCDTSSRATSMCSHAAAKPIATITPATIHLMLSLP